MHIGSFAYLFSALMLFGLAGPAVGQGLHLLYADALTLRERTPELFGTSPGLLVVALEPESRAQALGIRVGDIWLSYRDAPIGSLDAFLGARSEPANEGTLRVLRAEGSETVALPSGPLGAGLVELVELGLSEADTALFFDLLEAGYGGDRDRLMASIRGDRPAFERIARHFESLSSQDRPGAAQLRRWHESIANFLELDERLEVLQASKATIEAERAVIEQELAGVREARLLEDIGALERGSQGHIAEGNYDQALADALQALELVQSLPGPKDPDKRSAAQAMSLIHEANALLQVAAAYSARGEQRQGIQAAESALQRAKAVVELAEAPSDPDSTPIDPEVRGLGQRLRATALELLTALHALDGNGEAARASARERLSLAVAADDLEGQIDALSSIASSHEDDGDFLDAIPYLEQAEPLARDLDDPVRINRIEMALTTVYLSLGDYERAAPHANRALEAARRLPHRSGVPSVAPDRLPWYAEREAMALDTLGALELFWGRDPKQATRRFEEAAQVAEEFLKGTKRQASILSSMSVAYALSGETDKAIDYAERALTLHRAHRSPQLDRFDRETEAGLLIQLAELLISRRAFERAETHLKEAEALVPQDSLAFSTPIGIVEARARALCLTGSFEEAERLLRGNIARIENVRGSLSAAELTQVSFADLYASNYDLLQYALFRQGRHDDLLVLAEERRGRALSEQLAQRSGAAESMPQLDIEGMRHLAAAQHATLVVYSVVYDPKAHLLPARFGGYQPGAELALLIWVIAPDGAIQLRQKPLGSGAPESTQSSTDLVRGLRDATPGRGRGTVLAATLQADSKASLRRLFDLLIAPISDLLPGEGGQLVFVPQGPLLLVPFAALEDGSGHHLIERFPIATVPALKLLAATREPARSPVSGPESESALVVGNPTIDRRVEQAYGVYPLPHAQQEAETIAQLLGTRPLLGAAATKRAVLDRLPRARIVHFATHGLLDGGSAGGPPGAVVLAPEGSDDGLLRAEELMDQKLSADLAVLSACDTGRGRLTGDGVVGLSYALIRAGIPSVLVSLWSVPDESTAVLMTHFYRNLPRYDLAEALRRAMRATIQDGYPEPWQWAGFSLIGQWETPGSNQAK